MDFIVNPFITVLTLLYSIFGNNIVLAIVVFTVIVRLVTSPLLIQQQRSSEAMQELQPQIEKLKEKYKNDREKLSQAQMELYREKGINPLGGCLPLLVQMPIILGLYGAIIFALGSTPYQVVDLSGRLLMPGLESLVPLDKIFLGLDLTQSPSVVASISPIVLALPLLVMATTWLQSKLTLPPPPPPNEDGTPNPTAQVSRSMTTIMPLMFGFFSLSFSIGLSIYFIVSNTVGIIQYTVMGRAKWGRLFGKEPEEETTRDKKKTKVSPEDDELLEKIAKKVEEKQGASEEATPAAAVLNAKPSQPKVSDGTFNSSGSSKKRKKRKK